MQSHRVGKIGEWAVRLWLRLRGYRILTHNSRHGGPRLLIFPALGLVGLLPMASGRCRQQGHPSSHRKASVIRRTRGHGSSQTSATSKETARV